MTKPAFIVTIDTEGDNLWASPREIETKNAAYLPRFQQLCEEFGFKPTWLTNYEMAVSPCFNDFGRKLIANGTGEIGMHLHAWNSPPVVPLTSDDFRFLPYLIEYPEDLAEEKVSHMTTLLEDRFETKMVSHRAGRWAFNAHYAKLLIKYGYLADCSVTPNVSWTETMGSPEGKGGTDYSKFPSTPYFMDVADISRPDLSGASTLLEVPPTVIKSQLFRRFPWTYSVRGVKRFAWKYQPKLVWLYPDATNLKHMLASVREAVKEKKPYVEFVLHSSELMPGGSPSLPDAASIELLYRDLRVLFTEISRNFVGMTLAEFRNQWVAEHAPNAAARVAAGYDELKIRAQPMPSAPTLNTAPSLKAKV
ncbi:polysaccharide deacetylase family protein [soil metagenome]